MYSLHRHIKNDQQRHVFRSGFARKVMMTDCRQAYSIPPVTHAWSQGWSNQAAEWRSTGGELGQIQT